MLGSRSSTSLHYAVKHNKLKVICELLFYGANVNVLCDRNFSPFTYALYLNRLDIAHTLFPYYDEFSLTNIYGYTVLHLAAWRKTPIAVDLVKAGVNVNCVTNYGDSPLALSLEYNDDNLFKLIWSRCDYRILLRSRKPLLLTYVQTWRFPVSEWLECLRLILESSGAFDLIVHCNKYFDEGALEYGFFWELLHAFYKIQVDHTDRIIVISMCLCLGAKVNIFDINLAIELYGFNEELEALIYNIDWSPERDLFHSAVMFPLSLCICGMKDSNSEVVIELLKKQIIHNYVCFKPRNLQRIVVNMLGFFSFSSNKKQEFIGLCELYLKDFNWIREKLDAIPEIASLSELSRNETRKYIRQAFNVKKPYQFHDAVKMLDVPQHVKDIIRFKIPFY